MINYLDSAKVIVQPALETKIASELTQQLIENQMKIILKFQQTVLKEVEEDNYFGSELSGAIEGLNNLLTALRSGDFVILAQP